MPVRGWVTVELLLIRREISGAGYGKRKSGSVRAKNFGLIVRSSSYSIILSIVKIDCNVNSSNIAVPVEI